MTKIAGIHHISAICGDPQRNLDFYTGLLGLRLVKKTVNFDDPNSYHLYYADARGTPGTIMTFFAWISMPPMTYAAGRQGAGQIYATSFAIPTLSGDFWADRLAAAAIDFDGPHRRFDDEVITLHDPDGLPIELVACAPCIDAEYWQASPVPAAHAIRGFSGVALCIEGYDRSAKLLREVMGFEFVGQEGSRFRFRGGSSTIDLLCLPDTGAGRMGIGVTHHVAFRMESDEEEQQWREVLVAHGYDPTPVLDRQYFHSVYFREPGGIVFELATDAPGFTVDESIEELGTELKLPAWLEPRRARIEARLPELRDRGRTFG